MSKIIKFENVFSELHKLFFHFNFAALTGSLKRPGPSYAVGVNLRVLHSPLTSALNPEGIYVWGTEKHLQPPLHIHWETSELFNKSILFHKNTE